MKLKYLAILSTSFIVSCVTITPYTKNSEQYIEKNVKTVAIVSLYSGDDFFPRPRKDLQYIDFDDSFKSGVVALLPSFKKSVDETVKEIFEKGNYDLKTVFVDSSAVKPRKVPDTQVTDLRENNFSYELSSESAQRICQSASADAVYFQYIQVKRKTLTFYPDYSHYVNLFSSYICYDGILYSKTGDVLYIKPESFFTAKRLATKPPHNAKIRCSLHTYTQVGRNMYSPVPKQISEIAADLANQYKTDLFLGKTHTIIPIDKFGYLFEIYR